MAKWFIKLIILWCCYGFISNQHQNIFADEVNKIKTISEMAPRSSPINIPFIKLKDYHNLPKNTIYSEVLSYSKNDPFGDMHGRVTNIHETVHGINNTLNNTYVNQRLRGFYVGSGRAILLKQPRIKLGDIRPYIPEILREYRYKTYFIDSLKPWNDVPLYVVDEWSAYMAGAECAIDDWKNKVPPREQLDSVSGALEFSIYCTALCIAVKNNDPDYWYGYPEFKNSVHYLLIKSEKLFFEGKNQFPSSKQDRLIVALQNIPEADSIRNFLVEEFDGIFIK